ncbi:SCO family protein [soil metagenome]
MNTKAIWRTISVALAALSVVSAFGQEESSKLTQQMGITQKLGALIPQDAKFKDETGKDVTMADMFQGRPLVIVPIFFSCKTMCVTLTDGLASTLAKGTKYDELMPGRDFDVVMLSINPKETPDLAKAKKAEIFNMLTPPKNGKEDTVWRAKAEKGWHMLTGSYDQILKVTNAIGFKYRWDPTLDLINHPTMTLVASTSGKVVGYMIGPDVPTKVLQTDITLAKNNQIGTEVDQSFMFGCIMLDPTTGKYTVAVEKLLQVCCVLTVIIIATCITLMSLRDRRKMNKRGGSASAGTAQ